MATATIAPPPGFELDTPAPPEGFEIDAPSPPPPPEGFEIDSTEAVAPVAGEAASIAERYTNPPIDSTDPAGNPDRFEELGTTDRKQRLMANLSPREKELIDRRERNAQRGRDAMEVYGLRGSFLDQTPESLASMSMAMQPQVEIERIAASGINPGSINLDAFKLPPIPEGTTRTQEGDAAALEGVQQKPIIQLPTLADPTVAGGILNAGLNVASSLTSFENLALIVPIARAPKIIQQGAALGFGTMMIKGGTDAFTEAPENETPGQKAERITTGISSVLLGALAIKHGVSRQPQGAGSRPALLPEEQIDRIIGLRKISETLPDGTVKDRITASPESIDGAVLAKEKLLDGFNKLPVEIQKARQRSIDEIDENLLRLPREDVQASEARVKERGLSPPPTEGAAPPVATGGPREKPNLFQQLKQEQEALASETAAIANKLTEDMPLVTETAAPDSIRPATQEAVPPLKAGEVAPGPLVEGAKVPEQIKPSAETGKAATAESTTEPLPRVAEGTYEPIADALTQQAGELRMKSYRERDVSTPAIEKVDPAIETRIRQAAEELGQKTGFPSVKLADVLEQAGFDAASPESMAQAKGAIMRLAAEDKVELGGGDWSLAAPREKAWAVMRSGELQQNVRFLEAEVRPEIVQPKLQKGQNQGDLLGGSEDLTLIGEKVTGKGKGKTESPTVEQTIEDAVTAYGDLPTAHERLQTQIDHPKTSPADKARLRVAQRKMEQMMESGSRADTLSEADAGLSERNYELLDSIKELGGLPSLSTAAGKVASGELARVLESSPNLRAKSVAMGLTRKNAKSLETLREALNERGFTFETPYDMLAAVEQRLSSGKKAFGTSSQDTLFGSTGGSGPLQPNTASSAPVVPVKPMSEIIRDISKGIDVPIRFGRLTTNRFAGYFKKVQNLIGAKGANDISIVSHEVGHKLDDSFGISKMPALRAEMDKLGDPATPGSRSSWTPSKTLKYKHGEGVAEFVRHWLTDPAKAKADAPMTNKYFEAVMDANPDFGDVMRTAREDVQNWRNSPAEARLDSSISVGDNPNQTKYRLPQLTRDLVDDLHMLRMAVDDVKKLGSELPPSENPYLLSRLMRGSYGMADSFIRNGVADFKTRDVKLGTSFEAAMKPIAGRINEFRRWVVAKRAQELHTQGRETGLVPADVDFVANKYNADPAFQKAFEDVKKWNDGVLQYAVDSGYVSEKSAAAMRQMNADYVPFHRVFEIGAGESPVQSGGGTGRGLNVGQAGSLKRLTGSARDIVDPLETMIKNAYTIITASEKAAINKAVGDLANKQGMGKWVEEIATPKEAVKVELEKVRKDLEAAGADLTAVPDDLVMQFFRNSGRTPFGENVIKVTNRGETKFYRLKSELYEAFNALALDDSSRLIKMLSQPAQVLRAGVTLDPAFGLANIMRDAVGSAVINKYGMLPFEASARGVVAMFKNPNLVAEWAASGGKQSFEASFFDRSKTSAFLREKILKDLTPTERALVVLKSPLTALRYVSELAESATRIGEYERAYNEARKSGMGEGDARRQASFEARDRQDFAKGGAKTKILRQMAAFWNAGLQGNVAVYNAFKSRPLRSTLQGLAYVTLPTLGVMALNWKDEDYWDRPQWERDAFWLVPKGKDNNGKSTFVRIPKPFLIGVAFGMLPERMMQFSLRKDPKAFEGVMQQIAKEVIPNPMPQTAQVIVSDVLTGKQGWDMWRDRPVVPDQLADLPAELQWTEQTSLTARKIGEALNMSPMKIDHAIAGTTGGLGRQVVHNVIDQAIGAATGEKPTAVNTQPGARFFTTPAGISSQAVEDFYKQLTTLREKKAGAKQTGKAMDSNDDKKRLKLENVADKMSALRGESKKAKSADEKQRKYLEIARLAKEALR